MQRLIIALGVALLLIGLTWPWISKIGLGRLPGDIVIERQNFHFYFPIVTSLLLSIVLSILLWFLRK